MRFPWQMSQDNAVGATHPAFLIVGLGNPGRRYEHTRHNCGYMVADALAATVQATRWHNERQAAVCRATLDNHMVLFAKPETFMNNSGVAVRALSAYHHVPPAAVLVISDDLDLPFGRMRVRAGGSPGGHNGLRSIIAELGTQDFPRLRIGIGRPETGEPIEWVLSPFDPRETADLAHLWRAAADIALDVVRDGVRAAMNKHNGRGDVREALSSTRADSATIDGGTPRREEQRHG